MLHKAFCVVLQELDVSNLISNKRRKRKEKSIKREAFYNKQRFKQFKLEVDLDLNFKDSN